jgi:hypothetical protein
LSPKEAIVKQALFAILSLLFIVPDLSGQSGSINNTLGGGGTFNVKVAGNDSLLIVKDNGNVGIGTTSPASPLDVNGQLTADRLKVDGVPSFLAAHIEETNLGSSPDVLTTWDETPSAPSGMGLHDNSSSFNHTTGEFTAPRDGFYYVSAYIELSGLVSGGSALYVLIDAQLSGLRSASSTLATTSYLSLSGVIKLSANQILTVQVTKSGSIGSCTAGQGYFSAYLVGDF